MLLAAKLYYYVATVEGWQYSEFIAHTISYLSSFSGCWLFYDKVFNVCNRYPAPVATQQHHKPNKMNISIGFRFGEIRWGEHNTDSLIEVSDNNIWLKLEWYSVQLQLHIFYSHFISISLSLFHYWKSHWLYALFYYTERHLVFALNGQLHTIVMWEHWNTIWMNIGVFPLIIIARPKSIFYTYDAHWLDVFFQTNGEHFLLPCYLFQNWSIIPKARWLYIFNMRVLCFVYQIWFVYCAYYLWILFELGHIMDNKFIQVFSEVRSHKNCWPKAIVSTISYSFGDR